MNVSEELSSVETLVTFKRHRRNHPVSEELSSVETKEMRFFVGNGSKFQKNLVVWKLT